MRFVGNSLQPRRYVQYNNLVFSGTESVEVQSTESYAAKFEETSYSFKSGSYIGLKSAQMIYESTEVGLVLHIPTINWRKEQVQSHQSYITNQLSKIGRLWAVDTGGQLIWAHAIPKTVDKVSNWTINSKKHTIDIQVTFLIYEAKWHRADAKRTFLVDYSTCDFVTILSSCFQTSDCPNCEMFCTPDMCDICNNHELELTANQSICDMSEEIQKDFYQRCNSKWRIVWNCEVGYDIWGCDSMFGQVICKETFPTSGHQLPVILDQIFSDTSLPTTAVTVTLIGKFKNPAVTINGYMFQLSGMYEGYTTIDTKNGTIYTGATCEQLHECPVVYSLKDKASCYNQITIDYGLNDVYVEGIVGNKACIAIDHERYTL